MILASCTLLCRFPRIQMQYQLVLLKGEIIDRIIVSNVFLRSLCAVLHSVLSTWQVTFIFVSVWLNATAPCWSLLGTDCRDWLKFLHNSSFFFKYGILDTMCIVECIIVLLVNAMVQYWPYVGVCTFWQSFSNQSVWQRNINRSIGRLNQSGCFFSTVDKMLNNSTKVVPFKKAVHCICVAWQCVLACDQSTPVRKRAWAVVCWGAIKTGPLGHYTVARGVSPCNGYWTGCSKGEAIKAECNYTLLCGFPKPGHCALSTPHLMTQVKDQAELRMKSGRAGIQLCTDWKAVFAI